MINLISLLAAAALVFLQSSFEANAQLQGTKLDIDNRLDTNVQPAARVKGFVKISPAPLKVAQFEPGTLLELQCVATGNPAPSVQWLKNGEPIEEYLDEANEIATPVATMGSLVSTLLVPAALDGDVFSCLATAGMKQVSASTTVISNEETDLGDLIALRKFLAAPAKPIITEYYDFVMQEIGSSVVLPCRVHSYAKPQIFWQDNYNNLVYENPRLRVLPSGDLLISKLDFRANMGGYTCIAKNLYGKANATTFVYPLKPKH